MEIHETAILHDGAKLGNGVRIGAFSVVEGGTVIGDGTTLHTGVIVRKGTHIGKDCTVHHGAVLGGEPQDVKFKGENSYLKIGDRTCIREYVTLNRATGEGCETVIGDDCFIMAYSHAGHNCRVGDGVSMANCTALGGHVAVGNGSFIGGYCGIHQFVRVGDHVMVGGGCFVFEDVPHYMMVAGGYRASVCALNTVGLQRAGFDQETRNELKRAYRLIYLSDLPKVRVIETLKNDFSQRETIGNLIDFLEKSDRGVSRKPGKSRAGERAS
ncbi:MAG: acyl-ACP--UDP-N-acetylglucosamine O-acyltransferase [bacterium]